MSDIKANWKQVPETELMKAARQVLVALTLRQVDQSADGEKSDLYALHNINACANLLRDMVEALENS